MEFLEMIIAAMGGGIVVAVAFLRFAKESFEKYIDKKIDYHFSTKLENEKGLVEHKVFVSQHKFDKEFEIIQELMEKAFDFTYLTWDTYTVIIDSQNSEEYLTKYITACDAFTLFYFRNCAFIASDLANVFDKFVKNINEFRSAAVGYSELQKKVINRSYTTDDEKLCFNRYCETMSRVHDEVNKKSDYCHNKLVEVTRKYFERLEIK